MSFTIVGRLQAAIFEAIIGAQSIDQSIYRILVPMGYEK